jgi:hypothetical protein
MTITHLTDEQLTEYLNGTSLPAINDHLAACNVCRQEVVSMRASFQVFDRASLEWSNQMQNAIRLPARHAGQSWNWASVWAVACAAVIAAILLLSMLRPPLKTSQIAGMGAASSGHSDSDEAELNRDNQLLAAIDQEFDSADLSPQKMYGISESVKAR